MDGRSEPEHRFKPLLNARQGCDPTSMLHIAARRRRVEASYTVPLGGYGYLLPHRMHTIGLQRHPSRMKGWEASSAAAGRRAGSRSQQHASRLRSCGESSCA
jgi:hypothetical protein